MENFNKVERTKDGIFYSLNDELHRIDGPAIEYSNGSKAWYQNGKRHRIEGPAIEFNNGYKAWYQNGLCHRLDGPAKEFANGYKLWYHEDKYITDKSQKEFERLIKLKLFC
jgi:hypothetical protein